MCFFFCDPQHSHEGRCTPRGSGACQGLECGLSVYRTCTVGRSPVPVSSMGHGAKREEIQTYVTCGAVLTTMLKVRMEKGGEGCSHLKGIQDLWGQERGGEPKVECDYSCERGL